MRPGRAPAPSHSAPRVGHDHLVREVGEGCAETKEVVPGHSRGPDALPSELPSELLAAREPEASGATVDGLDDVIGYVADEDVGHGTSR